ncbi:probable E3 ubiquitin-protein ligase HERC3 isoform X2 [Phalaenopsis equestris]|uniref:probable E3 ubiquitin-protein ligase HERC3 isoform X2 n=1 Tax=Phalaenopsis equestris TaxID=78828 RepID=UPI0009E2E9F9|nr:probable E3 ubiquitin-protein ligase HERC3 isoform X2 [Phalaenopsis equestris]
MLRWASHADCFTRHFWWMGGSGYGERGMEGGLASDMRTRSLFRLRILTLMRSVASPWVAFIPPRSPVPARFSHVCRGYGGFGALGHSVYHRELLPRLVESTWMGKISHLATSGAHTAVITDSGELYTWGRDQGDGRLGLGSSGGPGEGGSFATPSRVIALPVPVAAVCCGGFFTMALTTAGQLWSWGANSNYELGRGDNADDWRPKPIPSVQDTRIVQIASGGYHSLALTDKGEVFSWGHGGHGQLGHSSNKSQKVPTFIEALAQEHITYIACGGSSSAAVNDKGELYMWGNAKDCQLGVPGLPDVQPLPVQVKFLVDNQRLGSHQVLSVSIGASHAMCLALRHSTKQS